MGEMLKELGKFFYNFALIIGGAGIVQPLIKGTYSKTLLISSFVSFFLLILLGSALIALGEKLKSKEG
jgi:hypothetical protein